MSRFGRNDLYNDLDDLKGSLMDLSDSLKDLKVPLDKLPNIIKMREKINKLSNDLNTEMIKELEKEIK